jgi:hypothetical protein
MKSHASSKVAIVVLGFVASCGYAAPYTSSGPSLSKEGVQISIAGERCFVNRSAEPFLTTVGDDRLNLDLRLQVKNNTDHAAVLSEDRVLLSEIVRGQRTAIRPRETDVISLQPGETKVVSLYFEQSGELDCHHEMALEPQGAVEIDGKHVVKFESIRFLASE